MKPRSSFLAVLVVCLLHACTQDIGFFGDSIALPPFGSNNNHNLAPPWNPETAYAPTVAPDGSVVSAPPGVCDGNPTAQTYPPRFLTPTFKDIAADGDRAWLVDGVYVWTLDLSDPDAPVRVGLQAVAGHPIAAHFAGNRLWIATIDQGLVGYAVGEDGLLIESGAVTLFDDATRVMDVHGHGDLLVAALGSEGVGLAQLGAAELPTTINAAGFAVGVHITNSAVHVAACDTVHRLPLLPDGTTEAATLAPMPFGAATAVSGTTAGDVLVTSGNAILGFRLGDGPVGYLGVIGAAAAVVGDNGVAYLADPDAGVAGVHADALPWSKQIDGESAAANDVRLVAHATRLYGLGGADTRALAIYDIANPVWPRTAVGYAQPNRDDGLSRLDGQLVVHGTDGRHRVVDGQGITTASFVFGETLRSAVGYGGGLFMVADDGRVARAGWAGDEVAVETLTPPTANVRSLGTDGATAWLADGVTRSILAVSVADGTLIGATSFPNGFPGNATLHREGDRLLAYDRLTGQLHTLDVSTPIPVPLGATQVGACVSEEARLLISAAKMALLCPRTGDGQAVWTLLAIDDAGLASASKTIILPQRVYTSAVVADDMLVMGAFDNSTYTSELLAVSATDGALIATTMFVGRVNALDVSSGVITALDGDFGLRRYDLALSAGDVLPVTDP